MLNLVANVEGESLADIEQGLEEVLRLIREEFTSGMNRNDTGSFNFQMTGEAALTVSDIQSWLRISGASDDALDDLVYDAAMNSATPALNQEGDADSQEEILEDNEAVASNVNNGGIHSQLEYLAKGFDSLSELAEFLKKELALPDFPKA